MSVPTILAPLDVSDALYTFFDWSVPSRAAFGSRPALVAQGDPDDPDDADPEPHIVRGLD